MLPTLARKSLLGKLFGESGVKHTVTLFHEPASASSTRVLNLLKQAQANATTTTTLDQASDNSLQAEAEHRAFELDVLEQPTSEQVEIIAEYVGAGGAGTVVQGAKNAADAVTQFKRNAKSFARPLVVNWDSGKVVVGDNQSEILHLLQNPRSSP